MKLGSVDEVRVPVEVVLGRTDLTLKDVFHLTVGSIIGLRSFAGEPVDLVASGQIIAKGEVVVIDENFGIRITNLVEQEP